MIDLHGFGDQLLQGAVITLELALSSLFVGLILGLLGASAKLSSIKAIRWIAHTYTTIIRGIPELLTVLIIYFGATSVLMAIAGLFGYDEYIEVGAFAAGVTALGLTFGAYATEVFRGALQSIPKGQHEAATALGMGTIRKFYRIILPQVWRIALPGLGNLFLVLLKDTALVSVVGLEDIMRKANIAVSSTKQAFLFYLVAAFMYLALTIISMVFVSYMEKRASRGLTRG
ncbi:ABC transporter permease [Marinomonas primoryensis]|jgi:polar amino acid transport system permease protein|uniref:ABC transporter permease n=1 Tax=Marinomonas primoryensis TaxID=178399 RepID=A0A2Z4PW80_9GAMM|nr:ABC transporter permease [Marinomonas primoryensis]AWY01862.1 ABC transporter permease [Marinomonas primoryensis]QKK81627.1 ABC transporter permease protein [Marinomonas primoryensis]|tara:strand:+ start:4841 stop:5530 length:690 start_codon:yes stop_codon:yes gene_type:complete